MNSEFNAYNSSVSMSPFSIYESVATSNTKRKKIDDSIDNATHSIFNDLFNPPFPPSNPSIDRPSHDLKTYLSSEIFLNTFQKHPLQLHFDLSSDHIESNPNRTDYSDHYTEYTQDLYFNLDPTFNYPDSSSEMTDSYPTFTDNEKFDFDVLSNEIIPTKKVKKRKSFSWTKELDDILLIIAPENKFYWSGVASELNAQGFECDGNKVRKHYERLIRKKTNQSFSQESEDLLLLDAIKKHEAEWTNISKELKNSGSLKNLEQLRNRFYYLRDKFINKLKHSNESLNHIDKKIQETLQIHKKDTHKWSANDDKKLLDIIEKLDPSRKIPWKNIVDALQFKNVDSDNCKHRFQHLKTINKRAQAIARTRKSCLQKGRT